MFSKETYISRRQELKKLVKSGVIILFGNNNSPCNFPNNGYYPFRQDSTFLYYFGLQRDGLVGVIDIDNDIETLIGDDIDLVDIVWYGSVDSVHDLAAQVGVHNSAPMKTLKTICNDAMSKKRKIHILPPYRYDIKLQVFDLLGIHPNQQKEEASMNLIKAVVKMRSTKTQEEIEELERAAVIGYKMHTTAMKLVRPGVTEKYVAGQVSGIAHSYGAMVSFPTIFSQHGEIQHGYPSMNLLEEGMDLIKAVVKMRSTKTQEEIEELERAAVIGYKMHTTAMKLVRPGVTEKYVAGQVSGVAHSYGSMVSFPTIFSQHGEIQHGYPSMNVLEEGRLALCDAGAETMNNYCSDNTRTMPVSGKFSQRQLEIYSIVEECHDHALDVAKPGVKWADVHFSVCRLLFDRMKELGLAKGDTEEAVKAGAHAMFLPHGLGHMMGMDVHDMENLDQINVGFDEEVRPNLEQFGTNCLRMGRRLQEGFVVTDEPGVYFIPALIDDWKASGHCAEFLNFDKIETYKDFGGIRIEDDVLITKDGCRFLGKDRIPYHPKDVEEFMAANKE